VTKFKEIHDWVVNQSTGVIEALLLEDEKWELASGGFEIGNWLGFCSQNRGGGLNCDLSLVDVDTSNGLIRYTYHVELPRALFEVTAKEQLKQGQWYRTFSATALKTSWMGDFVIRIGLPADAWLQAGDGKKNSRHKNRNTYFQYPIDGVEFRSPGKCLKTLCTEFSGLSRMDAVSYWRDDPRGFWASHHRLLVSASDYDHVVGRFRNKTITSDVSSLIGSSLVSKALWGFNERIVSRLPFSIIPSCQTQGVVVMEEGECVSLESRIQCFVD